MENRTSRRPKKGSEARSRGPDLDVTVQPPETPDPERTARSLGKLHALAERIRARLEREAREKGKRNDAA